MRSQPRGVAVFAFFSLALSLPACDRLTGGPKPTMTTAGPATEFNVPGKMSARLEPKIAYVAGKGLRLAFNYTGFPQDAALEIAGKSQPLDRTGSIEDAADVGALAATMKRDDVTIKPGVPVRVTFAKGKYAFDIAIPELVAAIALRDCLRAVDEKTPCAFPGEGAPSAKPNIAYVPADSLSSMMWAGSASVVRDIDWVAVPRALEPRTGQKCRMSRLETAAHVEDTFDLSLAREEVTLFDRRTGAKKQTKELIAPDRCPGAAMVDLADTKSALKSEISDTQREQLLAQFRGEASAPKPAPATTKPGGKPKGR